jgi:indolepyruvate ferredoxin oxidoreductase
VVGKTDEHDRPLLPGYGALAADDLLPALRRRLAPRLGARLAPEPARPPAQAPLAVQRTPFYCSGCPHNRSTRAPEGSLVAAGIGCHTMVMLMDPRRVGDVSALTCMGNEGTQWIGMSEFVEREHLLQNLGDGTYFHSGQLAIRAAVAAGVRITYKLLWNGAVAMTGGQSPEGRLPLAAVVRTLLEQGVARVLVTSDDPARTAAAGLTERVAVWDRSRLLEAQELLAGTPGTTVLIHDQTCAAEARRARRRGRMPRPDRRVAINTRICEGCGDCGRVSNCLSVQPVETPFGRKTAVDQTTCNLDFSCLEGDCPAFASVRGPGPLRRLWRRLRGVQRAPERARPLGLEREPRADALPEPELAVPEGEFGARIAGVGGTGVVTVSQVLGTAAAFGGYEVRGLDQIGLSQKAGPVVSDLRLRRGEPAETSRLGRGQADLVLALDLLVAASESGLGVSDPARTAVVGSTSPVPTGAMVAQPGLAAPGAEALTARLAAVTLEGRRHFADAAAITTALFGDALTANFFVVGMAFQAGCLPIRAASIERAIELNGVAVAANRAAFRWGRLQVANPEQVSAACAAAEPAPPPVRTRLPADLEVRAAALAGDEAGLGATLRLLAADLVGFQSRRTAAEFLAALEEVAAREVEVVPGSTRLLAAAARSLHQLTAYKDEYEVARLLLDEAGSAPVRRVAGEGGRIRWLLHPPTLRALGLRRKLEIPAWTAPAFRLLAAARCLRGTLLDPFGHTRLRRIERALPGEYRAALARVLAELKPERLDDAVAIARLPAGIRGYEDLKLVRVQQYRTQLAEELERLGR